MNPSDAADDVADDPSAKYDEWDETTDVEQITITLPGDCNVEAADVREAVESLFDDKSGIKANSDDEPRSFDRNHAA